MPVVMDCVPDDIASGTVRVATRGVVDALDDRNGLSVYRIEPDRHIKADIDRTLASVRKVLVKTQTDLCAFINFTLVTRRASWYWIVKDFKWWPKSHICLRQSLQIWQQLSSWLSSWIILHPCHAFIGDTRGRCAVPIRDAINSVYPVSTAQVR